MRWRERLENWAIVLFVVAFVLVIYLVVIWEHREGLLIAIGLLPGLAAAFSQYSERLAFKAQARQYDRMRLLFERAYDLLPERIDVANVERVRAIYRELGIEAMKENAEWVAVYRQRPIQPLQ
jgi:hypothetical protein